VVPSQGLDIKLIRGALREKKQLQETGRGRRVHSFATPKEPTRCQEFFLMLASSVYHRSEEGEGGVSFL